LYKKIIKISAIEAEKNLSINGPINEKYRLSKDICVYLPFLPIFSMN
jgi:hypothetical protein